jgi:ribosomal protein S18 acetylase RimI-like enzyme
MSSLRALQAPHVTIRPATMADHDALQALDGATRDSGAGLIQARRNFFSRMAAYDRTRVLVAQVEHQVVGMECLALTPVRVAGQPCSAGYSFNTRVAPAHRTRGLGSQLMKAGTDWLEREGCRYATGLVGVSNTASMKMVGALGWEAVARFDYLILDLARFEPDPGVRIRKVDALGDPAHAAWRFGEVSLHHFVPRYLVSELFTPYPKGPYMGSLTAFGPGGSAWVSLWDDRVRRGLDPDVVRAVKAYDVTLKGTGGFRAFSGIANTLREAGLDHVLMPLPHDPAMRTVLDPYAAAIVEFNFVVKRLNGAEPLPPGPIYFDIRH